MVLRHPETIRIFCYYVLTFELNRSYGDMQFMKKTSQTKSASTEANAQKTQTPIVAKLNGYHARTVLHKSRMEFAFLSNSIMICIICKKGIKYPKNIKSPCKIRIRLVWHNQYNTSARKKQVFERKENKIVFR